MTRKLMLVAGSLLVVIVILLIPAPRTSATQPLLGRWVALSHPSRAPQLLSAQFDADGTCRVSARDALLRVVVRHDDVRWSFDPETHTYDIGWGAQYMVERGHLRSPQAGTAVWWRAPWWWRW